jgi:hypothetical protein
MPVGSDPSESAMRSSLTNRITLSTFLENNVRSAMIVRQSLRFANCKSNVPKLAPLMELQTRYSSIYSSSSSICVQPISAAKHFAGKTYMHLDTANRNRDHPVPNQNSNAASALWGDLSIDIVAGLHANKIHTPTEIQVGPNVVPPSNCLI